MNKPLPDPYGYEYEDISSISNLKRVFPESLDSPSEASKILKNSEVEITEGLKDTLLKVIGTGFVNIIRGKLLNAFGINIDIANFRKFDEKNLENIAKFKEPQKVYISILKRDNKNCAVLMNKGKIVCAFGDKELVNKSDGYRSIINKSDSTWVATNPDIKEEFKVSKAQKILLG